MPVVYTDNISGGMVGWGFKSVKKAVKKTAKKTVKVATNKKLQNVVKKGAKTTYNVSKAAAKNPLVQQSAMMAASSVPGGGTAMQAVQMYKSAKNMSKSAKSVSSSGNASSSSSSASIPSYPTPSVSSYAPSKSSTQSTRSPSAKNTDTASYEVINDNGTPDKTGTAQIQDPATDSQTQSKKSSMMPLLLLGGLGVGAVFMLRK